MTDRPSIFDAFSLAGLDLVVPSRRGQVLQCEEHAEYCDDDPQPRASEETLHRTLSTTVHLLLARSRGALKLGE